MSRHARSIAVAAAAAVTAGFITAAAPAAHAVTSPLDDAFYTYTGTTPLAKVAPGKVLKTRTVPYSIAGSSLSLKAVQVQYATRSPRGASVINVTTVLRPTTLGKNPKVLSYQSYYDSLNPADEPSVSVVNGTKIGTTAANVESSVFAPLLAAGYAINVPDTEGQTAAFGAGPASGYVTLDSLKAISATSTTGISSTSKIGLMGYSGGAAASEWAAELASTYARAVDRRIVGTAIGGVVADPGHSLHYVEGSQRWSSYLPMTLVGFTRAFGVNLTPYLSDYGKTVLAALDKAPLATALGSYPALTWAQLAKTTYPVPEKVKAYVNAVNSLTMGTASKNKLRSPLYIGQGTSGTLEGTQPSAAYGAGDGVSLAGDVRTLARGYCTKGTVVKYEEYAQSHYGAVPSWLTTASTWIQARFAGTAAPTSCGSIAAGNSLAPVKRIL